jgi:hypothetical protein
MQVRASLFVALFLTRRRTATLLAAIVLASLGGCSGSKYEAQVSGRVTLDGKPVGPGVIVFAPEDGKSNPPEGAIMPDGSYFLRTSRDLGLPPGKYKVSVSVFDVSDAQPNQRSMAPPKLVTPERYASHETSPLAFEVSSGSNTIDVDLKSQ